MWRPSRRTNLARTPTTAATDRGEDVDTMIEWGSENWGGNVHLAANGSWVVDRHGDEPEQD